MSNLATYTFLPWLRQGIANQISGSDTNRATIAIDVNIVGENVDGNGQTTKTISKDIQIYGPGDIIGIDAKAIVKSEPKNWITNFETNYLPYIEFYDEDFPWRYTPIANPDNHKLKPWLALVVLKEDEFEDGKNIKDKPLPFIKLTADAKMPNSNELWAWAHVHINKDIINQEGVFKKNETASNDIASDLSDLLSSNPDHAYSRIISPRKLEEKKAYHAFLVPAFKTGLKAGLGESIDGIGIEEPAWDDNNITNGESIPYYHRWYFRTGSVGDFEYLVRLLEAKPVDSRVGTRSMDVQDPGANLAGIIDPDDATEDNELNGILKLGGALRIPQSAQKDLDEAQKYEYWSFLGDKNPTEILNLEQNNQPIDIANVHPFQKSLASFVNLTDGYDTEEANIVNASADIDESLEVDPATPNLDTIYDIKNNPDPLITAPIYGKWHAMVKRILKEQNGADIDPNFNWIHELNLDPRWRVAAGFGTTVIQENQEKYMDAAWDQIGEVLEANKKIREAQLAKIVAQVWYLKHLEPIKSNYSSKWLYLSSPVHKRVVSQGVTVFHQKKESILSEAMTGVVMRKMLRPGGKLIKRLPFTNEITADNLIDRVNVGDVSAAPPKVKPEGIVSPNDIADAIQPTDVPSSIVDLLKETSWFKYLPLLLILIFLLLMILFPIALMLAIGAAAIVGLVYVYRKLNNWTNQIEASDALQESNLTPEAVDTIPASPDFRLSTPEENFQPSYGGNTESIESQRFKLALKENNKTIQESLTIGEVKERLPLDLTTVNEAVFKTIDPKITIPRRTYDIVKLPPFLVGQQKEKFVEAMAYPKYDLPMYKPLADYSSELFLPNINFIDQNSISILETNQKFIESYMVGLNHEMGRELLWREYPTDQRGSYFRQFWEVNGFLDPQEITLENIKTRIQAVLDDRFILILKDFQDELNKPENADNATLLKDAHEQLLKEELKDIKPLHYWPKRSLLGDHDNRELPGESEEELVLVIRGELLKKYPTAVIYAHRAVWQTKIEDGVEVIDNKNERRLVVLTAEQEDNPPNEIVKTPLYEAKVDPDISFFGFDLTVKEADGGDGSNADDDPGWFFVIKERPGEPRFGLDVGNGEQTNEEEFNVWNDMSWDDAKLTNDNLDISGSDTITLTEPVGPELEEKLSQYEEDFNLQWKPDMNAAELAYILYQVPVLVAVHASEMLPK